LYQRDASHRLAEYSRSSNLASYCDRTWKNYPTTLEDVSTGRDAREFEDEVPVVD